MQIPSKPASAAPPDHLTKSIRRITPFGFALASLSVLHALEPVQVLADEPKKDPLPATISIKTSSGTAVPFTPVGIPQLEILNDKFNLAFSSREGMIFQITGIPAKDGIALRRYLATEFRALLLHSGFQEEAATDDQLEEAAMLEIRKCAATTGGESAEIHYSGKLRAGPQTLTIQFQFSGSLPADSKHLIPNQPTTPIQ